MFSLFRQRASRGFEYAPRYYDAEKEARDERRKRMRVTSDPTALRDERGELLRDRMRHSWQRQGSNRNSVVRLMLVMGMVCVILYFIIKGFGVVVF
ncbi:MAG: hypothetical protein IPL52_03610 [Flavobacteriales bacterium]|nr:hypothetical protein [Flavobacteriales bacterium]